MVGTNWLQKYLNHTKGGGYDAEFIRERESFKFGAASKIYESTYAAVIFIPIASQVIAVKAAVIHGDVPLLMSKPALTRLGLILDLGRSVASFRALQSGEIVLLETHSGHPALKVDHAEMAKPDLSRLPTSWENHGIEIFSEREVYMVGCIGDEQGNGFNCDGVPKIFSDKKIDGAVRDMLSGDILNEELFSVWWATTDIKNDFWLEFPHKLIRVHVTPRRKFFDPRRWETSHTHLRDLLLAQLGSMRETWGVGCLSGRSLSTVSELWQDRELGDYPTLWVGRSVFNRSQAPFVSGPSGHGCSMADDQRTAGRGVPQARAGDQHGVDVPGASDSPVGRHGVREEEQGRQRPEGPLRDEPQGTTRGSQSPQPGSGAQGDEGGTDAPDTRCSSPREHGDDCGAVPRNPIRGGPRVLRSMGVGGGTTERGQHARGPQALRDVEEACPERREDGEADPENNAELPGRGDLCGGAPATDERNREFLLGRGGEYEQRVQWTSRLDALLPGVGGGRREGKGKGNEKACKERERTGAHGTGDRRGDADGGPCLGDAAGDSTRQVRPAAAVREESCGNSDRRPCGAHDTHYEHNEDFRSCSSGSEDLVREVHYTSRARNQAQDHPGEVLASRRLEEKDFSYAAVQEILRHYSFKDRHQRRQGIHGQPEEGDRATFGYFAYGTFKGITKRTLQWPSLTTYLNNFLLEHTGGDQTGTPAPTWTSLALLHNLPAAIHADKNNVKGSHNFVVSFGDGPGGGMWVQEPNGGVWKRDGRGQEIEGRILETHEQGWEFDPRLQHCTEPFRGERWFLAGFTARTFPEANKEEKKLLLEMGFPAPNKGQIKASREREQMLATTPPTSSSTTHGQSSSTRPIRSHRKRLRKTAAALSVLLTTVLFTMTEAAHRELLPRPTPETPLLEIGGVSATCRLAEYGIGGGSLAEPIVVEDILHSDHPTDLGIGHLETATMRHQPGQLWIHVREEFGNEDIYHDLVEAVSYQLGSGRGVVFEKEIEEPQLWHDLVTGWEEAGYTVYYDFTANGNESIRVIYQDPGAFVNTVYAGDHGDEAIVAPAEDGGEDTRPLERGARAIRFPPSTPTTIATSLRRLHQNLGHPSTADFVRHLRLAGASREVLKAARALECQVCQRTKRPAAAKPAKIAPCFRFNEMVGTDLFYVHDSEGQRHQLLSIVDFSSAYHVVVPVARKDTPTLEKAFCENWVNVFGAPTTVAVDMENGLEKSLGKISDWTGTRIRTAAGQAHYQAGYTERQGAIWKEMFQRVCEEHSVVRSEMHLAIGAVSTAKNQLIKTSGFSPCQHVFGASPTVPEDLLNGPHADHPGDEPIVDDKHAREVALRTAARAAYFHVQTDERVRRALAGRARVEARTPEIGERVFYYRKTKNNKKGVWVGPGTVIGQEGVNVWVTRGGRCLLCAPEHVRLATGEELGQAFNLQIAQQDLDKLLNADSEIDEMFASEEDGDKDGAEADEDVGGGAGEIVFDMDEDEPERRGVRRDLLRVPPRVLKRQRRKGRGEEVAAPAASHEALMLKRAKTPRSREKQLEKEIPWSMTPEEMRPAFRRAEAVQWKEHVDTGALEVLSLEASEEIRRTVPAERILGSRYAYRDKHMGRRRADPSYPWKPKSRLVVAGHEDPDVGVKDVVVDSPTVSRASLLSVLQIGASKRWTAAAGDVQAAFLQGVELKRELWLAQPKSGVEGLHPRQLARIRKGVFGLSESPRMWYDRLSGALLTEIFDINNKRCKLVQSPLDPCTMMLLEDGLPGEPLAYVCVHVDDLLLVAPKDTNRALQKRIGDMFPVDGWLEDNFEYTGSYISTTEDGIFINQAGFVDGRLFTVDIPRGQKGTEPATTEQAIDNRSLIGALSWLSSQSRPDLLCGVTLSQQLQRSPLTEDVRFVNQLKGRAEDHREQGIYLHNIPLDSAIFLVYHDAAWANAELEEAEEGFRLTPEEIEHGTLRHLYSEERPRKPKRGSSKVASQLGHLVFVTDRKILDGDCCRCSLLEWRSQSCKRVCRSTFGAETMAAVEGLEGGQYMRALLGCLVHGRLTKHDEIRKKWPILCLSDCKSLHDYLHKAGTPRLPADRRLAIDLAALRQELHLERWGPRLPLQWIPTEAQLADPLTKPMKVNSWWERLQSGIVLPLKRGLFLTEGRGFLPV